MLGLLVDVRRRVKDLPPLRALRERRYRRWFLSDAGYAASHGVYRSFEEARRQVPAAAGFDQPSQAAEFLDRLDRVFAYDYPVMLWLDRSLREGARAVLDVGGSVGVHYHAYRRYLELPADLRWTVSEVPAVAAAGERLAAERGSTALAFTSSLGPREVEAADVLLSAGALHYIESPRLEALLGAARRRPSFLLLNKLPLHDGEEFVSLQNIRHGFSPHWVYDRASFVSGICALGYALVDAWQVPERSLHLFGHPERSVAAFSGLCFRRTA